VRFARIGCVMSGKLSLNRGFLTAHTLDMYLQKADFGGCYAVNTRGLSESFGTEAIEFDLGFCFEPFDGEEIETGGNDPMLELTDLRDLLHFALYISFVTGIDFELLDNIGRQVCLTKLSSTFIFNEPSSCLRRSPKKQSPQFSNLPSLLSAESETQLLLQRDADCWQQKPGSPYKIQKNVREPNNK
jgi:hypothetical protein